METVVTGLAPGLLVSEQVHLLSCLLRSRSMQGDVKWGASRVSSETVCLRGLGRLKREAGRPRWVGGSFKKQGELTCEAYLGRQQDGMDPRTRPLNLKSS